jgi:DNA-binding NarL/FixJ family response regulator
VRSVIEKTRVLVRDVPQLVRDVLEHAIATQPDMELLREYASTFGPSPMGVPDVVVVGTQDPDDDRVVSTLLSGWPRSQVLMITIDGHHAALYELHPRRTRLGEVSPLELLDAIRSTARRRGQGSSWQFESFAKDTNAGG